MVCVAAAQVEMLAVCRAAARVFCPRSSAVRLPPARLPRPRGPFISVLPATTSTSSYHSTLPCGALPMSATPVLHPGRKGRRQRWTRARSSTEAQSLPLPRYAFASPPSCALSRAMRHRPPRRGAFARDVLRRRHGMGSVEGGAAPAVESSSVVMPPARAVVHQAAGDAALCLPCRRLPACPACPPACRETRATVATPACLPSAMPACRPRCEKSEVASADFLLPPDSHALPVPFCARPVCIGTAGGRFAVRCAIFNKTGHLAGHCPPACSPARPSTRQRPPVPPVCSPLPCLPARVQRHEWLLMPAMLGSEIEASGAASRPQHVTYATAIRSSRRRVAGASDARSVTRRRHARRVICAAPTVAQTDARRSVWYAHGSEGGTREGRVRWSGAVCLHCGEVGRGESAHR